MLGDSPWGVRDSIPLTPPQTIRALDAVQRLFAAGTAVGGARGYACRTGYFLSGRAQRPGSGYVPVGPPDPGAPGDHRLAPACRRSPSSAHRSGLSRWRGSSPTAGLRPRYPAVEIYRVAAGNTTGNPGAPYLADIDQMPRVDGGPEALLRIDERRRLAGEPPLGPVLLTGDAVAAGVPVPVVLVTDTPLARETDYGRVDDHSSAIRAAGDVRHTFNRVPDYPTPGADTVYGAWTGGRLTASSSSSDPTALPDVATAASPAAAIDADSATAWVSNALQSAVGQWLQVDFDHPVTNSRHHHHSQPDYRRGPGAPSGDRNRHRHNHSALRRGGQAGHRCAALRRNTLGADHRDRHRRRIARGAVRASPTCRSPSTTPRATRIRSTCGTPPWSPPPRPMRLSRNGIWDPNRWAGRAARWA